MARGRHRRRAVWFGWLGFGWLPRRDAAYARAPDPAELGLRAQVALLDAEVSRLRALGEQRAAAAGAAERAAVLAEQQLGAARLELAALRTDLAGLREELAGLREELVWAFAERKLSVSTPSTVTAPPGRGRSVVSAGTG